jgi:hypothetical protein
MKAYIVSNTKNGLSNIDGIYYLITEEGEALASHWCSHIGFAMSDLYSNRPERMKEFAEKFGEFEVDYLGNDDMTMSELLERNKSFYADHPTEKAVSSNG